MTLPASFTLAPGAPDSEVTRSPPTSAAIDEWTFGALIWTAGDGHNVRQPVAVRPVTPAPTTFSGTAYGTIRDARLE